MCTVFIFMQTCTHNQHNLFRSHGRDQKRFECTAQRQIRTEILYSLFLTPLPLSLPNIAQLFIYFGKKEYTKFRGTKILCDSVRVGVSQRVSKRLPFILMFTNNFLHSPAKRPGEYN